MTLYPVMLSLVLCGVVAGAVWCCRSCCVVLSLVLVLVLSLVLCGVVAGAVWWCRSCCVVLSLVLVLVFAGNEFFGVNDINGQ